MKNRSRQEIDHVFFSGGRVKMLGGPTPAVSDHIPVNVIIEVEGSEGGSRKIVYPNKNVYEEVMNRLLEARTRDV